MYCWRSALLLVAMAAAFEGFADLDDATALVFARCVFVVFAASFLAATLGPGVRRIGHKLRRAGHLNLLRRHHVGS